mgnify:FL=1
MQIAAATFEEYVSQIPDDRKEVFQKLFNAINQNLPNGFMECCNYGMLGRVVTLTTYPDGYHCTPGSPLPFMNLASQKNFIALYHMGLYADQDLYDWFIAEFPKHSKRKLDMGKSCIRFKYMDDIPFELIAELSKKMSVSDWISLYESKFKK